LVFKWQDTRENRANDSKLFALLNDAERSVSATMIDAFRNYELTPVLWSERDKIKSELAA
jgi:hypothetical protein